MRMHFLFVIMEPMKKEQQTIKTLTYITGFLCALYGIIVLMILGPTHLFNYFFLCLGLGLIGTGCYYKSLKEKIPNVIFRILQTVCIILLLLFLSVEGEIIHCALKEPVTNADYVILLGSQIRSDGPSHDFQARIDAAYDYLCDNPDTLIIVSGGQGASEPISEALGAKRELIRKGISENRIITEEKSRSTRENLSNTRELLLSMDIDLSENHFVIVSADYHLYRAEFLARHTGFENISSKGSCGLRILQPHYYVREFFAFIKDWVLTVTA